MTKHRESSFQFSDRALEMLMRDMFNGPPDLIRWLTPETATKDCQVLLFRPVWRLVEPPDTRGPRGIILEFARYSKLP